MAVSPLEKIPILTPNPQYHDVRMQALPSPLWAHFSVGGIQGFINSTDTGINISSLTLSPDFGYLFHHGCLYFLI